MSETIKILLRFPSIGPFFVSLLQALPAGCHFHLHSQVIIVFTKGKSTPRLLSADVSILACIYTKKRELHFTDCVARRMLKVQSTQTVINWLADRNMQ
jgi:hypothetical protein